MPSCIKVYGINHTFSYVAFFGCSFNAEPLYNQWKIGFTTDFWRFHDNWSSFGGITPRQVEEKIHIKYIVIELTVYRCDAVNPIINEQLNISEPVTWNI